MVACNNVDLVISTTEIMNKPRRGSSVSSGFRLLDGDQCDTMSSTSRNSIYKQKIDLMFDDTKSIISTNRLDERHSLNDRRERASSLSGRRSSITDLSDLQKSGRQISNSVQAQIERMFTDVVKDATACSFPVRCLGALPLKDKVTSLQGLQEPLRQLYLSGAGHGNQNAGTLDICVAGLRVRLTNGREPQVTPFHNIAVWSAVKFVVSMAEGGAAFLPLITDPENIDKSSLFRPLSAADKRRLSSGLHSPIFAVVMRSGGIPKQLECHAFVCQTPEDAIVIAATLYQSLMAHVETNQNQKTRRPRNRNGISCVSIASSSTNAISLTNQVQVSKSPVLPPVRPPRKKRSATSSLSGDSDIIREIMVETSTEERKKKSSKTKRAPPVPQTGPPSLGKPSEMYNSSLSYLSEQSRARGGTHPAEIPYQSQDASSGDILTRVAIPRSGSFLNTAGLTRYKSRATRRHMGKTGGGGGSPLGFSELFNEFRLQENLHSLDEILNAIIDSDGMSFNDLKPIYKEFLLKLAVTLTKDELYQRSKSIMRRQKKKKLRRKNSNTQRKKIIVGAKGLKKVFRFGKFRIKKSTSNQSTKQPKPTSSLEIKNLKTRSKSTERIGSGRGGRTGTSGSEVSESRNEHILSAQNRNSSSGYVSCSECSYDSEACTCVSADRCYCSLGNDHEVHEKLKKSGVRDSMFSCQTEEKCYCSLGDEAVVTDATTWCDSDSCGSISKCYCRRDANNQKLTPQQQQQHLQAHGTNGMTCGTKIQSRKNRSYSSDNLALDYELFTVGNGGRHVKPHEALSVKKSVEMAALFADVKLSQTTDITSLKQAAKETTNRRQNNNNNSSSNNNINNKNLINVNNSNNNNNNNCDNFIKTSTLTTSQSEMILRRDCDTSYKRITKSEGYYNSVAQRPVSASLEDSLGYLP